MKYKKLTETEIREAISNKDYEAIYNGFFPLIKKMADNYVKLCVSENYRSSTDELFNDYHSAGIDGLYKAVELFNLEKGTPFLPYLKLAITSEMIRYFKKNFRNQYNITNKCYTLELHDETENDYYERSIDSLSIEQEETKHDNIIKQDILIKLIKQVSKSDRNTEMFIHYFGLFGQERMTLMQLGNKYGITHQACQAIISTMIKKLSTDNNKEILKEIL